MTRGSRVIRSLAAPLLALALALSSLAHAEDGDAAPEGEEDPTEEEDPLSPYRVPFAVLVERAIGSTSQPVEYNWRRAKVLVAATGDHLVELNNFNSLRAGGMARFPSRELLFEVGLSHVWVWDTPSSELLALTPYRQPGRPRRTELDFTVAFPLAEGVVTTFPRYFPALQMVFNGYAGIRYLLYPGGFEGMRLREVGGALLSPTLTRTELNNLEDRRLDAMQVDTGRYGVMVGIGDDIYF